MLEGAPAIVGTPGAEGARGITRAVLDSVINTIRLHDLPREQAHNYLQQFVLEQSRAELRYCSLQVELLQKLSDGLQELTAALLSANPTAKQPLNTSNWSDILAAHA